MKKLLLLLLFLSFISISYADYDANKSSENPDDFKINPALCQDETGPDCAELRLGDDYFTTSTPAIGFLYSCNGKNPNAPDSRQSDYLD